MRKVFPQILFFGVLCGIVTVVNLAVNWVTPVQYQSDVKFIGVGSLLLYMLTKLQGLNGLVETMHNNVNAFIATMQQDYEKVKNSSSFKN